MRPRIRFLAVSMMVALLVTACGFGGFEPPPPREPDLRVTAGGPGDSGWTVNIPARSSVLVRIQVGSSPDLLVVEAESDGQVELEVGDSNRRLIASSSSPDFFGVGSSGLQGSVIESQEVSASPPICIGPCVSVALIERSSDHYFAVVRNRTSSSASVQLFAYIDIYADEYEPGNNRWETTPAVLDVIGSESGAIETVGDLDHWRVQGSGYMTFDLAARNTDIDIALFVLDSTGFQVSGPHRNGARVFLEQGEYVLVRAVDGRAGRAATSLYYLSPG